MAASLVAVLALTVAGCGSGGDASSSDSGASVDKEMLGSGADSPAGGALEDSAARDSIDGVDIGAGRTEVQTRSVISTGEVQLEADDLTVVRSEIDRLLGRYGGFVAKEETRNDDEGRTASSTLQIRVSSAHFDDVMNAFSEFSTVVNRSSKAEDVTTEVIDVDSRIRTQEISLARLRKFLGQANRVVDVIRLESEIARREADLASLRSQQDYLADQTSLATITVRMALPADEVEEEDDPLADAGFLTGLRNGWEALTDVAVVAATAVGALLPFAIALGLVLVPLVVWLRTRNRRRAGPPAAVSPPPAG